MRHLSHDILRTTQLSAIAASMEIGRGDKNKADQVAVDAMRTAFNELDFIGEIVVGEGEKDNAPLLKMGERVGNLRKDNTGLPLDIACDPLDGTTQTARGGPEAMSVVAMGEHNSLFAAPSFYMKKIAVGPGLRPSIKWPIAELVAFLSTTKDKPAEQITVCLLDRPRHEEFIKEFRRLGCRVKLILDCDVSWAIATALPNSSVDLYYGIGGAPEGVLAAAALQCFNGYFEGVLVEQNGTPISGEVLTMDELAKGDLIFAATGVTQGNMLDGVKCCGGIYTTHSLLTTRFAGQRNIHWIKTEHF